MEISPSNSSDAWRISILGTSLPLHNIMVYTIINIILVMNAISLPAIRSTPKFSKFLWEQFRFFFEVKVSSEIPLWNKYTMRSYAFRQHVCDVPYSRGQWVPVLLGLRCALTSTIFPRSTFFILINPNLNSHKLILSIQQEFYLKKIIQKTWFIELESLIW